MHAIEKFKVFKIRVEQAWLQLHYVCEENTYHAHQEESSKDFNDIWHEFGIIHIPDRACNKEMKAQVESRVHDLTPTIAEEHDKREHFRRADPEGTQFHVVVRWDHLGSQWKCNFTIKQCLCKWAEFVATDV